MLRHLRVLIKTGQYTRGTRVTRAGQYTRGLIIGFYTTNIHRPFL